MKDNRWIVPFYKNCIPCSDEIKNYLFSRGATSEIIDSLSIKEIPKSLPFKVDYKISSFLEKHSGNFIVPLFSPSGKICGIQAQDIRKKRFQQEKALEGNWNAIFLNCAENLEKIEQGSEIWLCEGIFDLIALQRVFFKTKIVVLACLTAGLSYHQALFLKRFASRVKIVYDMDETGDLASKKTQGFLRKNGIHCMRVKYPAKDPGELWFEGGEELLRKTFLKYSVI